MSILNQMTEVEKLQKENKNLKDLLEEVYEMSFLDDMINDGCKDRNDDEALMCNLSLRSQIKEALNLSMTKKSVEKIENVTGVKVDRSLHLLKHNSSKVLADHYSKEDK